MRVAERSELHLLFVLLYLSIYLKDTKNRQSILHQQLLVCLHVDMIGCPSLPSLVLANVGEGSSADGCSELEGSDDNGDWLLLLLVSLLKTGDWLLPVLWIGLEVQSSPGCFFWMSVVKDSK